MARKTKISDNQISIFDFMEQQTIRACVCTVVQPECNKKDLLMDDFKAADENFRFTDELRETGAKKRFQQNVEAITTAKRIQAENRNATVKEQKIMSLYNGWGGTAQVFDSNNKEWGKEYKQLKELLTDAEYKQAKSSVNNAFYTSSVIVKEMWNVIKRSGFRKGSVLEPSMGIGNFFGYMPEEMRNVKLYGVEMDSITGNMAKELFPKADISVCGFEETKFEDSFFDVVIGNVPFGGYKIYDKRYNKLNLTIHNYFIAKAIDKVRPGGVIAVITGIGTLDQKNSKFRNYIAERAKLLGAVRLPGEAFKNAGTTVTSDILFLQKKEKNSDSQNDWINVSEIDNGLYVNNYFIKHPEMMLGEMKPDTHFGGSMGYCVAKFEDSLEIAVKRALENIKLTLENSEINTEKDNLPENVIPAIANVKNFTYTFVDGILYYRINSIMKKEEKTGKTLERIKALDEIRKILRNLITIQMDGDFNLVKFQNEQKRLNKKYDTFVKEYGAITSKGNVMAFREDSDFPLLCSLEIVNENNKIKKADIFYKRTITAHKTINKAENASEALNICLNERNRVDLEFMHTLYQPDISHVLENVNDTISSQLKKELEINCIIEELKGIIFLNPIKYDETDIVKGWETAGEYLSGNVREKLRIAKEYALKEPEKFRYNVELLEKIQPELLTATDIDMRLGITWIEKEDYEQFIYELLKTPIHFQREQMSNGITLEYDKVSKEYFISNKGYDKNSVAASKTYGSDRLDAYSIIEASLNLKDVVVKDRVEEPDGKIHYVLNKKETMIVKEKQTIIREEFKNWIFRDLDRRNKYVDYYNEHYNCIRLRQYDGSHITFPGMTSQITLKKHQKDAVARILMGGNTLLSHCVGAGKSFVMFAACMEMKRLGISNKTIMTVPKSLVGQTASEFLRLYPAANILTATEYDFSKQNRKRFISRIATGDYDCIIMSHSQFERINISAEKQQEMVCKKITELEILIADMQTQNNNWTVKKLESEKKKLEAKVKELIDENRKDIDNLCFEELGIDAIVVDEAHAFKNCAIFSKMNNIPGINSSGSKRAMDMLIKCDYITEKNNGKGVVFATATPISNSMCEMYVMLKYLAKNQLEELDLYHFDSWAAMFGEVTTSLELTVDGNSFQYKSRFNKFTNLPELLTLFGQIADVQTKDTVELNIPKYKGGKPIIDVSEPNEYIKEKMSEFAERAEKIRNGGVDPSVDNFLKITHEARLLGTDVRLLDETVPDNRNGKLNHVVRNVVKEYRTHNIDNNIGTQIIFSDIGTPKKGFNVYDYIKNELILCGIPADEIAFIHDADTDAKKKTLFNDMTNGRKKILIGSTDKCGTGVNVQKHIVALHHVDCPWKPAYIEQREGRGLRQGNLNKEVAVYRYVTKSTFDAYSWALVENKQRFISQVMSGKNVSRNCEDIDEATLSYAEIKAVSTGNPLIKEKMMIDNDLQKLRILKSSYDSQKYALQDAFMVRYPKLIENVKYQLKNTIKDIELKNAQVDTFSMKINGFVYHERKEAGNAIINMQKKLGSNDKCIVGEYKGFEVYVQKDCWNNAYVGLKGYGFYETESSFNDVGITIRIDNLYDNINEQKIKLERKLEQYYVDMEQSKIEYEKPFIYENELQQKMKRRIELEEQLDIA